MPQTTPFTSAEVTDIRRFCGFPAYAAFGYVLTEEMATLDTQLAGMSDAECTVVRTIYLANLAGLEAAILTAANNIGTDQAAVWTRNKNEMDDRTRLFNDKRRALCAFIGVRPGRGLTEGGRVVRT